MKPVVEFEVIEWAGELSVLRVRVFGVDDNGESLDKEVKFPEPVFISDVHSLLARTNAGSFRR